MNRREKRLVDGRSLHDVVADGAEAAAGAVGGRLVPVVMINTSKHPVVAELIRLHEFTEFGDCTSQWGTTSSKQVLLHLQFLRPVVVDVALRFEMPTRALLVDMVLSARALYLQHGLPSDTMKSTYGRPRVLIELPPTGFEREWEGIFSNHLQRMHRDTGLTRIRAKASAAKQIQQLRRMREVRLTRSDPQ